jgi:hypothetical protein
MHIHTLLVERLLLRCCLSLQPEPSLVCLRACRTNIRKRLTQLASLSKSRETLCRTKLARLLTEPLCLKPILLVSESRL